MSLKAALEDHAVETPVDDSTRHLIENAERQLPGLQECLSTIGLLTCSDVYQVNHLLRSGGELDRQAPVFIDGLGFRSTREFVDDVSVVFDRLGEGVALDPHMTLFRGIRLPAGPADWATDIASLGRHLFDGTTIAGVFTDAGYGFATPLATDAQEFPERDRSDFTGSIRVLFEMLAKRGLCVPSRKLRSKDLLSQTFGVVRLDSAMSQVTFDRGTSWKVISIAKESRHDAPVIKIEQTVD